MSVGCDFSKGEYPIKVIVVRFIDGRSVLGVFLNRKESGAVFARVVIKIGTLRKAMETTFETKYSVAEVEKKTNEFIDGIIKDCPVPVVGKREIVFPDSCPEDLAIELLNQSGEFNIKIIGKELKGDIKV